MSKEKDLVNLDLDLSIEETKVAVQIEPKATKTVSSKKETSEDTLISCLKNERIIVRFIPRETGLVSNTKHIFYGGMAENAFRKFTVPIIESSGAFVNVLTNTEKAYLEYIMGLETNALSIYLKKDNFWENYSVRLTKGDNLLDLSIPDDYIKYKVLLANRDFVAGTLAALQDSPKATYQYVIIAENDETKSNTKALNAAMQAYMLLGKFQDDKEKLRFIIESIEGRPLSSSSKLDFLQGKAQKAIQADAKFFVAIAEDEYLDAKVLVRECIEVGLIRKRGDFLYLAEDNSPLCASGEDPTLNMAAKFISLPKNQQMKLTLEARLKKNKE